MDITVPWSQDSVLRNWIFIYLLILKEIDYYVDRKVFSGCRRKKFPTLILTPLIFRKGNW